MADLKISALTGASTPLAGTEVLPIVQSSSTVKVSVANLTAGRAVGMLSNTINGNTVVPSAGSIAGTNLWAIGADATNNTVLMDSFGSNNFLAFRRASGTAAAPTAVTSGSSIINIGARGYGATTYSSGNRVSINMSAAETWTDSAQGTRMAFNTTAIGATTLTERMSIENTGNVNITTGNIVPSTAAKGVNFTANTPAAGMTSQLLNWYEEGTFTPTIGGDSVAGAQTYNTQVGFYTRIGNRVNFNLRIVLTAKDAATAGNLIIGGLPFTSDNTVSNFHALAVGNAGFFTLTALYTQLEAHMERGVNFLYLGQIGSGVAYSYLQAAAFAANSRINISGHYMV